MQKESLEGHGIQVLMILIALIVMFFGGLKFLIISIVFYGLGGFYESIVMNKFYGIGSKRITKKDGLFKKVENGFLWVHDIMLFRKRYNITIYDFKNIGQVPSFVAYLTMNVYVLVSYLLFINFSYIGFVIYLIPAISNTL